MEQLSLSKRSDRRAFTLIELLVVIAIMAILMAMTMPMIPGVNDQARIVTCESRLQQVGVALRLYAEDHRKYPRSLDELVAGRYLDQQSLLRCDKTGRRYYYRPASLTAAPAEVIAGCVAPNSKTGERPHRHGKVSVMLHVNGEASLTR